MRRMVFLLSALALAGCGGQDRLQTRLEAQQAAIDPPALWRVEAVGPDGAVAATQICADTRLREGFSRARAEAEGQVCVPAPDYVDGVDAPLTCFLGASRFLIRTYRMGDPTRDFTVLTVVRQMDGARQRVEQRLRFVRQGACPTGWIIGQQARLAAS